MFNVAMPANAAAFFAFILDCASFNIINLDPVYRVLGLSAPED
jgi:hypothetical protein